MFFAFSFHFQSAIDPMIGLKKEQALDMAKKLGFKGNLADEVNEQKILMNFSQRKTKFLLLYF